ncbi:zinc finger protein 135-like [Sceloporus undulatus]|uniref:zinc finger protein 135-like n=1 Tax=Sceloporus undulatus TaxID=8520 RepID=UPI001C4BF72D|nr:zinc finger protein 135-like [Sceloporus undulatus]XP_042327573.1 zinc finger protein 135-like [Sceloporus undulatus]
MAMEMETRSLLAKWIEMEPTPEEIDSSVRLPELPNLVQCGTIEDLLHDIAPQQAHPGPTQCWEDAWKQVLEALDTQSFPYTLSSENPENEGVDCPQKSLEEAGALEELALDPSFPVKVSPTLSENTWILQFQLGDDIESCLEAFEQAANAQHWPKEEWVAQLKPHLSPKAFLACRDLGLNVAYDYDVVKASILRHYGITTETQRQCFRQYGYLESKGPREACQKLRTLAWRWLKPEKHTKEQILEQFILEQFLAILPQEMQRRVRECSPETCNQAVDLAEGFQLGTEPPVPFEDISMNFSDEEWATLSEEQRMLYQDVMLENFQNVSTLGFPQEKHELIFQIKQGEETDFQDDTITDLPESQLTGEENSPVPPSEEQPVEKKAVSEKANTAAVKEPTLSAETTEEHSDLVESFGCEPSSPEKQPPQPVKQSPVKTSSAKTQPTKKQTSSPKGRTPQKKKQQPPVTGEPAPRTKQPPPLVSREVSGKQESDAAAVSTPQPPKRKKGTPPKGRLPKLKMQAAPVAELPKLSNKSETQGVPPNLKKELLMPEKTSPQKKSQSQQETICDSTTGSSSVPPSEEQPMEKKAVSKKITQQMLLPPDENAKPHKITIPVITWHPPFSATVVSDLTCLECGRSFRQRADLRHHQYVHTREKPYTCSMCNKCFRHPSHLHIHLRTHSGERPYKCPECGKAFSQSCNLRTHRQIHTGSKPFRCCVCTKSFRHKSNLTIHERVHTGERPYPCSVCPKRFSDRSTLVQHERTHTGERPYACRVCEQRFSQLSHLVKHTRVHPGARGPPKPKPTRVLSVSPPKNSLSQPSEKDSSLKTTESKKDQNNLAWISKT